MLGPVCGMRRPTNKTTSWFSLRFFCMKISYKKTYIHGANKNIRALLRNETAHEQDYVVVLRAISFVCSHTQKIAYFLVSYVLRAISFVCSKKIARRT